MWRKREIMELQNKVTLSSLIDAVPTDTSGKWVKKEDLYTFASAVANHVLTKIENNINDSSLQTDRN
jgi:hypothetical protein